MCGNNLNDFKKAFDNNINNAEDKNKTDSGEKIAPIGRNLRIVLVALCVVNIIAHLACYSRLPENVPIHWSADGSVNGYGPRTVTLILDILPLLCLGLFPRHPEDGSQGRKLHEGQRTVSWIRHRVHAHYVRCHMVHRSHRIRCDPSYRWSCWTYHQRGAGSAVRRLRQLPSAHAPELHFRHQNALGFG